MSLVYVWNRIYYVYLGGLNKKKIFFSIRGMTQMPLFSYYSYYSNAKRLTKIFC